MPIKSTINAFSQKIVAGFLGFSALVVLALLSHLPVKADNPTFFFSSSAACSSAVTTMSVNLGDAPTLYVCIDADNEGQGLLGAETHISYPTATSSASSMECGVFDTCVDLSEDGTVKFLAASGPLPDGQAATTQRKFGSFVLSLDALGSTVLNFDMAQIINESEEVENRSGLGLTINVNEASVEEVVIEVEEVPVPEEELPVEEVIVEEVLEEPVGDDFLPEEEVVVDEGGDEIVEEVIVEDEDFESTEISSIVSTPLSAFAQPGDTVQIVSRAYYTGGRPYDNITSCFPCPTPNNSANGTTAYNIVSGPGSFTGSKVAVNAGAVPGEVIVFNTHYDDAVSGTSGLSGNVNITVVAEGELPEEVVVEEEEVPVVEEEEEVPVVEAEPEEGAAEEEGVVEVVEEEAPEEVVEEGAEGAAHAAAPDHAGEAERALRNAEDQRNSDLLIPSAPRSELCLTSTVDTADNDQDGLSDRTECYLGTDPANPDSDDDGCWDGEEVNRFYASPLHFGDCNVQEIALEQVIITDPKPDWIVKSLDISGISPLRSQQVGITAFPALRKTLAPVIRDFEMLVERLEQGGEITDILPSLERHTYDLNAFTDEFGDEYEGLSEDVADLTAFVNSGAYKIAESANEARHFLEMLGRYEISASFLGTVNDLKELSLGQTTSAGFRLVPDQELEDGMYYLVATASLPDGKMLSSAPVRMILDSTVSVPAPVPQYLDGRAILDHSGQIRVGSGRPVLSGQSTYGVQLFATWESLILASSIIADSDEGVFSIQSPRELERNQDHVVSVYAVNQQERGMVRSETAVVDFSVGSAGLNYTLWAVILLGLLALASFVAKRRMFKIDHLAPEHRAKENELYEAFGLETPHEEMPADHEQKQKEVEEAFKDLDFD